MFVAITLAVAFLTEASFIGGVRPFDAGDDGLVYDGFARMMLQHFLAGNVGGGLEGGEPVFYYTPGMRYLRAAEHVIFGESYLGYLALILALPFLVFATFRRFLPPRWALASALIFAATPVGIIFGSSLVLYIKWAARGFADPAAFALFLAGFVLLPGPTGTRPSDRFGAASGAGLLFALALFVRPNLAPAAGILLAGTGLAALWQGQYRRLAGLCIGFLPVLGMALHNWIYGGAFVLFTTTTTLAMSMPPSAYLAAFLELLHLEFAGGHVVRAARQIGGWLAGPSELVAMAPLHAAAILVVIRVAVWRRADPWLRLTACATLVQQCVGLFFLTYGRYYYLTWLLTLLVVVAWGHDEGIGILRRRSRPQRARRCSPGSRCDSARSRSRAWADGYPGSGIAVKLAALALIVAVLGLPINDLLRYALLVIATVLIVVGPVAMRPRRWLGAVAVAVTCVAGQNLLAPPGIEEGHNVFIVDGAGGALERGLPRDAFRRMAAELDARYPAQQRCDRAKIGCWRHDLPDQPFAFSADGAGSARLIRAG
jgi:hypothetical protein